PGPRAGARAARPRSRRRARPPRARSDARARARCARASGGPEERSSTTPARARSPWRACGGRSPSPRCAPVPRAGGRGREGPRSSSSTSRGAAGRCVSSAGVAPIATLPPAPFHNLITSARRASAIPSRTVLINDQLPPFVADRPLTRAAVDFAAQRHDRQRRESDAAPFLLHPLEVAALLVGAGFGDEVVAAGVLHDILEKTEATSEELREHFGERTAALVEAVSEDAAIDDYEPRK